MEVFNYMHISVKILRIIYIKTLLLVVLVACIGNSITQGNMGPSYVTKLQLLLGSDYDVENDGISGTTLLKSGDKPYWKYGRLQQIFSFKPDIITIKLGTNDTKPQNWDSKKQLFKQDYLSTIDQGGDRRRIGGTDTVGKGERPGGKEYSV